MLIRSLLKFCVCAMLLWYGILAFAAVETDKEFIEDQILEAEAVTNLYQNDGFKEIEIEQFDFHDALKNKPDLDTFNPEYLINTDRLSYFYYSAGFKLRLSRTLAGDSKNTAESHKLNSFSSSLPLILKLSTEPSLSALQTNLGNNGFSILKWLKVKHAGVFFVIVFGIIAMYWGIYITYRFLHRHQQNKYARAILDIPKMILIIIPYAIFMLLRFFGAESRIAHTSRHRTSRAASLDSAPESSAVPQQEAQLPPQHLDTHGQHINKIDTKHHSQPANNIAEKIVESVDEILEPYPETYHQDHESLRNAWSNDGMHDVIKQLKSYTLTPEDVGLVVKQAKEVISHGRIREAGFMLMHCIEDQPKSSLTPWLLLFDIYITLDQPNQFIALAQRFSQTFNVATPSWDHPISHESDGQIIKDSQIKEKLADLHGKNRATIEYIENLIFEAPANGEEPLSIQALTQLFSIKEKLEKKLSQKRKPKKTKVS